MARRKRKVSKSFKKANCTVYALVDHEGRVRYIGQTRTSVKTRFGFHKQSVGTSPAPVHEWMRNGYCAGFEIVQGDAIWNFSEALWIKAYREAGARLLNVSKEHDLLYAALARDYTVELRISAFEKPKVEKVVIELAEPVKRDDGKWLVGERAFENNAAAWRWIDRRNNEPISRSEEVGDWSFRKDAGSI